MNHFTRLLPSICRRSSPLLVKQTCSWLYRSQARRSSRGVCSATRPMRDAAIADHGHGLGIVGHLMDSRVEKLLRLIHEAIAKKGTSCLQHQLDVVLIAKIEDAAKRLQCAGCLAELEQRFS